VTSDVVAVVKSMHVNKFFLLFTLLLGCGLFFLPCPLRADDSKPPDKVEQLAKEAGRDAEYLFLSVLKPDRKTVVAAGGIVAATGLLVLFDDDIRDFFQENQTDELTDLSDCLGTIGSAKSVLLGNMALLGAGYWIRDDKAGDKLLRAALVSTEAQLFTEGLTVLLKFAVGRERPDKGKGHGKTSFKPFQGFDRSLPSGHAARAFAVAAVFADRYGHPVPFAAYSAAALIGLSRVYQDDHFASDVFAGAALGFAVGKALSRRHADSESRWSVLPFVSKSCAGLSVRFTF